MSVSELATAPSETISTLAEGHAAAALSASISSPALPEANAKSVAAPADSPVAPLTNPLAVPVPTASDSPSAPRAERRSLPRTDYDVLFGIAPYDENEPEGHQNFTLVHGCDVSPTGVGLFSMVSMKPQLVVIAMGTSKIQPIFALAKVIHCTPIEKFGTQGFLIGCQLIKRLKRTRGATGIEAAATAAAEVAAAPVADAAADLAPQGAAVQPAPATSPSVTATPALT